MGKHLPGPWFLEWDEDCESFQIYDAPPDENGEVFMTIATVHVGERPSSQAHQPANARLIKAAPELLEALREASAIVAHHTPFGGIHARFTDLIERIEGG